jgi:hypothetical protein
MRCAPFLLAVLLGACGQSPNEHKAENVTHTLAADPVRLKVLRAQCAVQPQAVGDATCQAATAAFRQRFFAGWSGADEYRTLAELPPIPPSFDEPVAQDTP